MEPYISLPGSTAEPEQHVTQSMGLYILSREMSHWLQASVTRIALRCVIMIAFR